MHEVIITNQKAQIFFIYCIGFSLSFPTVSIINNSTTGIIVKIVIAGYNTIIEKMKNKYPVLRTVSLSGQGNINTE